VTVHDVEQRSPEWAALRLGRLCGSRAHDMMATISKGEAAGRRNLRAQLVLERVTGRSQERGYVSQAMQNGIDREAEALALYEAQTGSIVVPVGFVTHDTLQAGCSPDGIVYDWQGGVEVKSPIEATHFEFVRTGKIPSDYLHQITANLWLTGLPWWDYCSFNPFFPEPLRLKIARVPRMDAVIETFDAAARAFLAEVDREVEALQTLADPSGQLARAAKAVA
jgi:hypothetical protein